MTIDLDVIPRSPSLFKWGELKRMIQRCTLNEEAERLVGNVTDLCDFRTKRSLNETDAIQCPGYYFFQLAKASTLSMSIEANTGDQEDSEYLDDVARNMAPEAKEPLLKQWEKAGFLISISSFGGRPKGESEVMIQIARCIAVLTNGLVAVKENGVFDQSVGVYSAEEFSSG